MASARVRIVVASMERFIDQAIRKLVLDIVANLKAPPSEGGTPVDTGWARANWIPQIGKPRTSTAGSPENPSEGTQTAALAQVAGSYTREQGPVFISNNVPYILRLNEGHSQQAPRGFVQAAVAKAIRNLA